MHFTYIFRKTELYYKDNIPRYGKNTLNQRSHRNGYYMENEFINSCDHERLNKQYYRREKDE